MSSSNTSSISTPSTNASSERIYDFEYMMKLAASSASAMSSTSTLAQLSSQEDVDEIVKPNLSLFTTQSGNDDTEEHYNYNYDVDDEVDYDEDDEEEEYEEYGSWYDIRTDLSEEQLDELRSAVYDAISLTLPLSPVSEPVSLPLLPAPRTSLEALVQQQQQQQQYSAPIVRNSNVAPPTQFQSRAFATLAAKRQPAQRQSQTGANRTNLTNLGRNANPLNAHKPSNAFNWRREVPTFQTRPSQTRPNIKANVNVNAKANTVSSWRKTSPGTEWKYNEESNGYTLIKV